MRGNALSHPHMSSNELELAVEPAPATAKPARERTPTAKPKKTDTPERKNKKAKVEAAAKPKKKDKKAKDGKRKGKKKPKRTAKTSDRHELYQLSVQAPDVDADFFAKYHRKLTGEPARVLREDFCGTGYLASHWVTRHRDNRAIGVDLDAPTLAWGLAHNIEPLETHQKERIELIQQDVRTVRTEPCDVLAALNFSYSFFETRDELRAYMAHVKQDIREGGLLILDAWGGGETQVEQEEERDVEDFYYIWDQRKFDPLTYHSDCRIHFRFQDGTEIRNAFRYEWRQWTLPELLELMAEAGYADPHVLWEGTDRKTMEGDGKFKRVKRGEADPAWIAYVVGRA
jgi:SAM-dependent methyltransferase